MSDYLPASAAAELKYPGALHDGARDTGSGRAVHRVQAWCTFGGAGTPVDGEWGSGTTAALKTFQTKHGLPADGVLSEPTWLALTEPMRAVLRDNVAAPGQTLSQMVLQVAHRHLAIHPVELGGQNSGPWVRLYMDGQDGEDQLWCAGFSCFILSQANAALGHNTCPIPREVGVDALAHDAKRDHRFIPGGAASPSDIAPGSLFVERSKNNPNDWIHTGIVISADAHTFRTTEGNSDHAGSSNGYEATSQARSYGRYDFLRIV